MSKFRVRFETKDGSLIMNRPAERDYYVDRYGRPLLDFLELSLGRDAREKGVKVVSWTLTKEALVAIVDWL